MYGFVQLWALEVRISISEVTSMVGWLGGWWLLGHGALHGRTRVWQRDPNVIFHGFTSHVHSVIYVALSIMSCATAENNHQKCISCQKLNTNPFSLLAGAQLLPERYEGRHLCPPQQKGDWLRTYMINLFGGRYHKLSLEVDSTKYRF